MINVNVLKIADLDSIVKQTADLIEKIFEDINSKEPNIDMCSLRGGVAQMMINNMVDDNHGRCAYGLIKHIEDTNKEEFRQYEKPN